MALTDQDIIDTFEYDGGDIVWRQQEIRRLPLVARIAVTSHNERLAGQPVKFWVGSRGLELTAVQGREVTKSRIEKVLGGEASGKVRGKSTSTKTEEKREAIPYWRQPKPTDPEEERERLIMREIRERMGYRPNGMGRWSLGGENYAEEWHDRLLETPEGIRISEEVRAEALD